MLISHFTLDFFFFLLKIFFKTNAGNSYARIINCCYKMREHAHPYFSPRILQNPCLYDRLYVPMWMTRVLNALDYLRLRVIAFGVSLLKKKKKFYPLQKC